jgi:hypothetical protein
MSPKGAPSHRANHLVYSLDSRVLYSQREILQLQLLQKKNSMDDAI